MPTIIAMITARVGSQRVARKNLRELAGVPLIMRAIRKCQAAGVFDAIWVNSEHPAFGEIAAAEGVGFHGRPEALGNSQAISEQYIAEFLEQDPCDCVVQVHSIAPLLSVAEVRDFVRALTASPVDALLAVEPIRIECAFQGQPVKFTFAEKTNSQDLEPIQRLSWSIAAWRRETYLAAVAAGGCATYAGRVGFPPSARGRCTSSTSSAVCRLPRRCWRWCSVLCTADLAKEFSVERHLRLVVG